MPPRQTRPQTTLAFERLRSLIFSGELAAGSDHLERDLADRLAMSRTPVREAVMRLAGQGLLEVRPRKGVRVCPLSPSDMAEIYDILTELESLAAANAATRALSDEALAPLDNTVMQMDTALAAADRIAWSAADDAFHAELVRLGNNSRVQQIAAQLADQVRRARHVTLTLRDLPQKSNDDHRAVVQAIRDRDPESARNIHGAHRIAAKALLIGLLTRHNLNNL